MALTKGQKAVRAADSAVDFVVLIILGILLAIGGYSMWDNDTIESGAASSNWKAYKPVEPAFESFGELQKANPDVIGWIEIYGTTIDYPLLYSDVQDKYLTKNAYGEYTLSGSIFLDAGCDPHFNDLETIIYGHHMEKSLMFGPLDNFEQEKFFSSHRYGWVMYDGVRHGLDIWTCIKADAYDYSVYRRGIRDVAEESEFVEHLQEYAVTIRDESKPSGEDHIVLMSTCAGETTNGRTLVIAKITDDVPEDPFADPENNGRGLAEDDLLCGLPWFFWAVAGVLLASGTILIIIFVLKKREKDEKENQGKGADAAGGQGQGVPDGVDPDRAGKAGRT